MDRFVRKTDYRALSLQDLLDVRDPYQVHIANLKTVVGTAVGRYRIRLHDKNFHDKLVATTKAPTPFAGPADAADAVVKPMRRTIDKLPPEDILASYNAHRGSGQSAAMWADLGERTLRRMADIGADLAVGLVGGEVATRLDGPARQRCRSLYRKARSRRCMTRSRRRVQVAEGDAGESIPQALALNLAKK